MKACLIVLCFLFFGLTVFSQHPQADFTIPAGACLNETIPVSNQSTNASRYEWDFCQGDLSLTPSGELVTIVPGSVTVGVDMVFDGTNWFGFTTSRETNSIKRLDFGSNIYSTPTIVDLGNPGGVSPWRPIDIKVVHDNGEWFAFVYGESTNLITRIDLGSLLSNSSGITAQVIITGDGNSNCGLDVVRNGNQWVLAYSNTYSFGTAILNTVVSIPTPSEQMHTANLPGVLNLGDINLVYHNTNWYAYLPSYGSLKLFRAKLGVDPLAAPVLTDVSNGFIGGLSPFGIDIGIDNGDHIALISTIEGPLLKINLGNDLDLLPVSGSSLGNLGLLVNTLKIDLVKHLSTWTAFTMAWNGGQFFRINFPTSSCSDMPSILTEVDPLAKYATSGTKAVSLRAFNGSDYSDSHKSIVVNSSQAPLLDFGNDNICTQSVIQFTLQSNLGIVSSDWDFGDTNTSTIENPTHQYAASGDYNVSLAIAADNGCNNYIEKTVSIFDEPIPDFTLPSLNPLCTNQDFLFDNTSTFDPGHSVTWQWSVNGVPQSTAEDLNFAFTQTSNQDIKLSASVPGCENNITKSIASLVEGPVTDFSFLGQCEDENVTFTNGSSGTIDGYSWNFNDGSQNATDLNPTHTFSTIGVYDVTLTASNTTTGCNNTKTKSVTIYTKPQVNFTLMAPPFSCNGTPSKFKDQTPSPTDSNIDTWAWNFGDAGSGLNTSTSQDPLHTYANAGDYNVSLLVTTNFSCSATLQLPVTISPSPVANFSNTATCEDVSVIFTDTSVGTIDEWNWTIGSAVYTTQNPTHAFINSGNTSATLTVIASNDCISTLNKPIVVPVKLTADFSVAKNCVNQQTVFTDITNGTADPVSSQSWNFGGLGTATGTPANFTFSTTGPVSVTLNIATQAGCTYPISKSVNIIGSPQANFTASPLAGAPPLTVQFTNTSANATSYHWDFHDANSSTSTEVSPSFVYQDLGEYQAELTAFNAQNCLHTFGRTIRVVVPVADVALGGLELVEFQNGFKPAVTIFNRGNAPIINLALLLNIAGPVIREHVNAIITSNTSYRHVFSFEFPATSDIDYFCVEAEITDITPSDNEVCLSLEQSFITFPPYPNPSKGSFQLDWIIQEAGIVNLTVINSMGQEEQNLQIESAEGLNPIILETAGLSTGVYFVKLKYQQFTKVYRVFVSE